MINKLLKNIEEALNELLLSFLNGAISEIDLLKILNEAVHYNTSYQPYIYEMFFIQALKINKMPKSAVIINMLFKNCGREDYLLMESYGVDGTRMKILKKMGLKKSIELYEFFLVKIDPESHIKFEKSVHDQKYIKSQESNVTLEIIRDSIMNELK